MAIAIFAETLEKTTTSDADHPLKLKLYIELQPPKPKDKIVSRAYRTVDKRQEAKEGSDITLPMFKKCMFIMLFGSKNP
jgi:hypothetical protein